MWLSLENILSGRSQARRTPHHLIPPVRTVQDRPVHSQECLFGAGPRGDGKPLLMEMDQKLITLTAPPPRREPSRVHRRWWMLQGPVQGRWDWVPRPCLYAKRE